MALTPEVQSFIDILHEETRDAAWQARVQESYEAAQTSMGTTDVNVSKAALGEILRQNVDDAILEDVMDAAQADDAEDFAQITYEKAQSWDSAPIDPRLEVDIARAPRPLGAQFNGADPQQAERVRSAAIEGDLMLLVHSLTAYIGMKGADADNATPGPDTPSVISGVRDVQMTSEGKNLFNYMDTVLTEANLQVVYDMKNPPADGQLRTSLNPAEMEGAFRAAIERDIQNGTFPIAGLELEDVDAIVGIIKTQALENIQPVMGTDMYGNTFYSYDPSNDDLRMAANVILTGDQAVVPQQMVAVTNQAENGQVMDADAYGDIFYDLVSKDAGIGAQDIIEHFRPLLEGYYETNLPEAVAAELENARNLVDEYTRDDGSLLPVPDDQREALSAAQDMVARYADYQGQFVPPVINIPEDKHGAFYAKIEEAFEIAARPNEDGTFNRDADAFGQIMAEDFQYALPNGVREGIRHEVYDHGAPVHVRLGDQTDNSIAAVDENNAQLFEFANFRQGESFSLYGVRGDVNNAVMEEVVADLDNMNDLRTLFGDEFDIRVVSEPDFDLEEGNTNPIGYFIESENGNSFYIGFDSIPEENVSAAFREARARDMDTQSRDPVAGVDYSIGNENNRPGVADFNM